MSMRRRSPGTVNLVVDAWPILAWLGGEPEADRIHRILRKAEQVGIRHLLSVINAGEIYYRLAKAAALELAEEFQKDLRINRLPIQLVPVTNRRVWEAARLKARYPIAYADAFAVALARETGLPLLTGDPDLIAIERAGECRIRWIARPA